MTTIVPTLQNDLEQKEKTECLTEIKGDLFKSPATSSLAHCISVDINMGKGIAPLFKSKFGGVEQLKAQKQQVGGCAILKEGSRFIYYLTTKEKYWNKPTYESLQSSLEVMKKHAVENKVEIISMPILGCGLDKLVWSKVKQILISLFSDTAIRLVIYRL